MNGRTNVCGKPEEEKTVTAGTSVQEVIPSSGKVIKKVTVNPTPTESKSVTPTTSELTVTPSEGKHLSQVIVGAVEDVTPEVTAQTPVITQILEGLVGKAQGANATADKILEGYSAYVGQELLHGTAKDLKALATMWGCTKMAVDRFSFTSDTYVKLSLPHSLGSVPSQFIILANPYKGDASGGRYVSALAGAFVKVGTNLYLRGGGVCYRYDSTYNGEGQYCYLYDNVTANAPTDTNITLAKPSTPQGAGAISAGFRAGTEYTLITMA